MLARRGTPTSDNRQCNGLICLRCYGNFLCWKGLRLLKCRHESCLLPLEFSWQPWGWCQLQAGLLWRLCSSRCVRCVFSQLQAVGRYCTAPVQPCSGTTGALPGFFWCSLDQRGGSYGTLLCESEQGTGHEMRRSSIPCPWFLGCLMQGSVLRAGGRSPWPLKCCLSWSSCPVQPPGSPQPGHRTCGDR